MTILDFYKKLSAIMEKVRMGHIYLTNAQKQLDALLQAAKEANLDVKVSPDILKMETLEKFDDEMSYEEESSYEDSYDEDED